jgi:hypothetical protein
MAIIRLHPGPPSGRRSNSDNSNAGLVLSAVRNSSRPINYPAGGLLLPVGTNVRVAGSHNS